MRKIGGGAYSFVACLRRLTIDHASLSRRSCGFMGVYERPLRWGWLGCKRGAFPHDLTAKRTPTPSWVLSRAPCPPNSGTVRYATEYYLLSYCTVKGLTSGHCLLLGVFPILAYALFVQAWTCAVNFHASCKPGMYNIYIIYPLQLLF